MISRSLVVHVIIIYPHYSDEPLNEQVYWAARDDYTEEVVRLLGRGADPNWQDKHGWSALHEACAYNHHQMLTVMINKHANINIEDRYKDTPLHLACSYGSFECVPLLVSAGCDSG